MKQLREFEPQPGDRIGDFTLGPEISRGGFGIVFRADHVRLEETFALKCMLPRLATAAELERLAMRFEREVEVLRTLRHPHIVRIVETGQTPRGLPYFAMEFVEGQTLKELISEGPLSIDRVRHIGEQTLAALAFAHGLGVVHRDLKPGNIILRRDYGWPDYVTLIDFGIAKVLNDDSAKLTATGHMQGTPLYMAPEQIFDQLQIDGRTDLYALGLILAECLTGRPVLNVKGGSEAAVIQAMPSEHTFETLVQASAIFPVIERAARKSMASRFPDAEAMQTALTSMEDNAHIDAALADTIMSGSQDVVSSIELSDTALPTPVPSWVRAAQTPTPGPASGESGSIAEGSGPTHHRPGIPTWGLLTLLLTGAALLLWAGLSGSEGGPVHVSDDGTATTPDTGQTGATTPDTGDVTLSLSGDRLLTTEREPTQGALSPDATYLATIDGSGVIITTLATGDSFGVEEETQLGYTLHSVQWYPDRTGLLLDRSDEAGRHELYRVDLLGWSRKPIISDASQPAIAPDGLTLAFVDQAGLHTLDLESGARRLILPLPDRYVPEHTLPVWAPDGDALALVTSNHPFLCSDATLVVVRIADGMSRSLPDPRLCIQREFSSLAWLPEGILAARREDGQRWIGSGSRLYLLPMSVQTLELGDYRPWGERFTHDVTSLFATADFAVVGYLALSAHVDIQAGIWPPAPGLPVDREDVLYSASNDWVSAFLPDGAGVVFFTDRNGSEDIFVVDLASGNQSSVHVSEQRNWWPSLGSGGDWLHFWETSEHRSRLMQVRLGGGLTTELFEAPAGLRPSEDIDVRCAYAVEEACVLARRNADVIGFFELHGTEVATEPFFSRSATRDLMWDLSPEGRYLAIYDGRELTRVDLDSGVEGHLRETPQGELPTSLAFSNQEDNLSWVGQTGSGEFVIGALDTRNDDSGAQPAITETQIEAAWFGQLRVRPNTAEFMASELVRRTQMRLVHLERREEP